MEMDYRVGSATYYLCHWLVSSFALILTSKAIRGFKIKSLGSAMIAVVVITIANIYLWPVLIFLTLPINIVTLGLFTLVVNGALLKICAALLSGFDIDGWWAAIFGSIFLSIFNSVLRWFFF